jgi:translocation and assembly module TamB
MEVSQYSGVNARADRVEGRLLDHLSMTGLRITVDKVETVVDGLDLSWRPFYLLTGRVHIRELSLRGVRMTDRSPPSVTPPDLSWPKLSRLYELIDCRIKRLQVNGFTYSRPGSSLTVIDSISTSVGWRFRLLSFKDIKIKAPAGSLKGSIAAGFSPPFLKGELQISPSKAVADMKVISLRTRLLSGRGKEELAGEFTLSAGSNPGQGMKLVGEAGVSPNSISLRRGRLTASGRRGEVTGEGVLDLHDARPAITMTLKGKSLDLKPETGIATDLSGEIGITGNFDSYGGTFSLNNRGAGWRSVALTGGFQGNGNSVKLRTLNGRLLDGRLAGGLEVGWQKGLAARGSLTGAGLNPAGIDPDWKGLLNFDLSGSVVRNEKGMLEWDLDAMLKESILHGQALTGEVKAGSVDGDLRIARLFLKGKGFDITGSGELKKRVNFVARISDLSRLIPDTAGTMAGEGWMRWQQGGGEGAISMHGNALAADKIRAGSMELSARLSEGKEYPLQVKARLAKVSTRKFQADAVTLLAEGTLSRHMLSFSLSAARANAGLSLSGGYREGSWQGEIVRMSGRDDIGPWDMERPARLAISQSGLSVSPLAIRGIGPEHMEIAGELDWKPPRGNIRAAWGGVNLARLTRWLKGIGLAGSSSGNLRLTMADRERLAMQGTVNAAGTLTREGRSVSLKRLSLDVQGDEKGISARLESILAGGGSLRGSFSSPSPARPTIPDQGDLAMEWKGFDLMLLKPWLPDSITIDGAVEGSAAGRLISGNRLEMDGKTSVLHGSARFREPKGEMKLKLRNAELAWKWRGETLTGSADLSLEKYGEAKGNFRIPLPARLPPSMEPGGQVDATISGRAREHGILTALFPGLIEESKGEAEIGLTVSGRWQEPLVTGNLNLARAEAYLPTAGIHVKDLELKARLDRDHLRIDSMRASSGKGRIEGSADIALKGWKMTGYQGKIDGDRFRTVYFPELQMECAPHLTFAGTPEKVTVRGELQIPEMIINGPPTGRVVEPSSDVRVEGRKKPTAKGPSIPMDIQARVVLGEKVLVKAAGIDARLAGKMDLVSTSLDNISSKGEIRVVKGSYKTYGVDLDIVRGRVYYAGGPLNRPTLDILALRTIGDVQAGVTVGGVIQNPVIKLYSVPAMTDTDILSYIVLGQPLGGVSNTSQTAMLAQAAGVLLSSTQSTDLQSQLKSRLGLSTLGFETASSKSTGTSGYKVIPVSPTGVPQPATTASDSLLTVGKYLTPKLYLSYGRSLITNSNLFRLRYDIYKKWQIETQAGAESGGDIFYTIEFE